MIELIQTSDAKSKSDILDQMFQLRARVFHDLLKWDVTVEDGKEIDQFDGCDPLYILSICEHTGKLQGSVRLLPTTGPNMLADVFYDLLGDGEQIISPLIYESSRFSVNPDLNVGRTNSSLNSVTVELLCGLVEVGMYLGIDHIVSVYDQRMSRIFRKANCDADVIGGPMRFGKVPAFAGLFDITMERWNSLAATGDLTSSVFAPHQQHLSGLIRLDPTKVPITKPQVQTEVA